MSELPIAIYDISPPDNGCDPDHDPNTKFSRNVCSILAIKPSKVDVIKFSDGETDIMIPESTRKQMIFIFQSYVKPLGERMYEQMLFLDAVTYGGGNKAPITVVWPYCFGSRGERRVRERQQCNELIIANMLGSAGAGTLLTGGIHAESAGSILNGQGVFFEHLKLEGVAANYIMRHYGPEGIYNDAPVAILSPDKGGMKRIHTIEDMLNDPDVQAAENIKVPFIVGSADKIRRVGDSVEKLDLKDSVEGHHVMIVDDIAATLKTLTPAVISCRQGGAKSVRAFMYHAVLGDGYEKYMDELFDNGLLDELIVGNTIPIKPHAKTHPKVRIVPFEPLFAEAIKRIYDNNSMSELHEYIPLMKIYDEARHLFKGDQKYIKIGRIKLPTLDS